MPRPLSLRALRDYAVARSLFPPTTLARAIDLLGFVQADPIRAPARAQDLTLRHRVEGYRAGDLERLYTELPIDEDHFVNYGFLPRRHLAWMLPRVGRRPWDAAARRRVARILDFVTERGEASPHEVEERFGHGTVTNAWGGSSRATTHLLEGMHYRGLLRVARRDAGVRVYAPREQAPVPQGDASPAARAAALLDLAVSKYAPLPARTLGQLASFLRRAAPQHGKELKKALAAARVQIPHALVDGIDWYWPAGDDPASAEPAAERGDARFLAPFDPIVWDRHRFERFWGWAYRFEAYTPQAKRKLGYYALPLLWRGEALGWGSFRVEGGSLLPDIGYVAGRPPRERAFARALEAEVERMRAFLLGEEELSSTPRPLAAARTRS